MTPIDANSPPTFYSEKSSPHYQSLDNLLNPSDEKSDNDRNSSSAPYKLHKSCDYCRHRKIKCVRKEGWRDCDHCRSCEVECTFSRKMPSKKRKMRSAKIAASLRDGGESVGGGVGGSVNVDGNGNGNVNVNSITSNVARSISTISPSLPLVSPPIPTHPTGWYFEPLFDLIYAKSFPDDDMKYHDRNGSVSTTASHLESSSDGGQDNASLMMISESSNNSNGSGVNNVKDAYTVYIEAYTPFFHDNYNDFYTNDIPNLVKYCISLSSFSSPNSIAPIGSIELLYEVIDQLLAQDSTIWNDLSLSSIFCVVVRYKFAYEKVVNIINKFQQRPNYIIEIEQIEEVEADARAMEQRNNRDQQIQVEDILGLNHIETVPSPLPLPPKPPLNYNLYIGLISTYAWNSFVCHDHLIPPIKNDSVIINLYEVVSKSISDQTFALHYIYVSTLLYRFKLLMTNDDKVWDYRRRKLIQLELELLLWPVKLPKHLTVVKDELIATPGAIILHVLHNTVLIAYYCKAIQHKKIYGKMLSILPVPGLLQFICGMASSSFKCRSDIVEKWPIIKDCLVLTARLIYDLYKETDYENCKVSLSFFKDQTNGPLNELIKETLGEVNWAMKHEDGATLYWIFRDVRSMSLQHMY